MPRLVARSCFFSFSVAPQVAQVLQLLHLDFHQGSRKVLTRRGQWVKPLLVGFIDDRSRFLCLLQWYINEGNQRTRPRPVPGATESRTSAFADDRSRLSDDLRGSSPQASTTWVFCTCRRCPTHRASTSNRKISGPGSRADCWPCSKAKQTSRSNN